MGRVVPLVAFLLTVVYSLYEPNLAAAEYGAGKFVKLGMTVALVLEVDDWQHRSFVQLICSVLVGGVNSDVYTEVPLQF